jgi:hypothetical protein
MGIITKRVVGREIDWPVKNCRILVENNVGELEAIHIHIGPPEGWIYRIHFTLDEFREFGRKIIDGGKL